MIVASFASFSSFYNNLMQIFNVVVTFSEFKISQNFFLPVA